MSHYSYKKKLFLSLPNNQILPLCLYADSSVTSSTYDRYGRKHIYHPKHWCVNTLGANGGIVVDVLEFNKAVNEAYEHELQLLREFNKKYEPDREEPGKESYSYYGNVYPSGGKMKNMKSFYSTKHLVDTETFLKSYPFRIIISMYNPKTFEDIATENFYINTVDDILKANNLYLQFKESNKGKICVSLFGLEGID